MRSPITVAIFVILAILCFIVAVLYWTGAQHWTTSPGPHHKHALLFAVLGVVSLVIASFARPQRAVRA